MPTNSLKTVAYGMLLAAAGWSFGCASNYEPTGQFWPNLSSGGVAGAISAEGEAGTAFPTAGAPGNFAGSGNDSAGSIGAGAGAGNNSFGGSGSTGGASASAGSAAGGRPETSGGSSAGGRPGMGGGGSVGGSSAGGSSAGGPGSGSGGATTSATCSLSVSVTTTAPGGQYAPRNVGAIWVANSTGAFVKSLEVWGNQRLSHVTAWNAATKAAGVSGNKVDAITSATLSAHRAHNVTWNCQNYNHQAVADGTYRVYFEVTDSNQSGPNHFESFAKGSAPVTVQGSSTNFNNISLVFKP